VERTEPFCQNGSNSLLIIRKQLGEKKSKIVISANGNSSDTQEVFTELDEASTFCLQDDQVLHLGHIAHSIENELGQYKPVDLEWAIDQVSNI